MEVRGRYTRAVSGFQERPQRPDHTASAEAYPLLAPMRSISSFHRIPQSRAGCGVKIALPHARGRLPVGERGRAPASIRLDRNGARGARSPPAAREEVGAHQAPRASGPQADDGPGSRPMPMLKRCRNATGSAAKSRPRPIAPVRRSSPMDSTLLAPIRCSTSPFESRDPVRRARLNRHEPEFARPRRVRPPDRGGERPRRRVRPPSPTHPRPAPQRRDSLPPGRRRRGERKGPKLVLPFTHPCRPSEAVTREGSS